MNIQEAQEGRGRAGLSRARSMRAVRRWILSLGAAAVLLGCGQQRYQYGPVRTTGAEIAGSPAAAYDIPPDAPRGSMRLAMMGVSTLHSLTGLEDSTLRAVRLAFVVSNRSDETWTVDLAQQHIDVPTRHGLETVYATTVDITRPTAIEVPPRSSRWIDLYFPLPFSLSKVDELPAFDAVSIVNTGTRAISQRTTFARFVAAPPAISPPVLLEPEITTPGERPNFGPPPSRR